MIGEALSDFGSWLKDLLLWLPLKIYELLMDALASLIEALPVPEFITSTGDAFSGIGGNILFFASKFAIAEGMVLFIAALVLRFILRRIPFIG